MKRHSEERKITRENLSDQGSILSRLISIKRFILEKIFSKTSESYALKYQYKSDALRMQILGVCC